MNKAFIFDMDGVLIASEKPWHDYLDAIWPELIGKDVATVFNVPVGMTPLGIYGEAIKHGSKVSKDIFLQKFDEIALKVYNESEITEDTNKLGEYLIAHNFKIGLVSSSRLSWIQTVVKRLSFGKNIAHIISINDRPDLEPKPSPVSYRETIKHLNASPQTTIILEDSNSGILAAKAAGAYTIGLTSNLLPGYEQHGADAYADNMNDVIKIVNSLHLLN